MKLTEIIKKLSKSTTFLDGMKDDQITIDTVTYFVEEIENYCLNTLYIANMSQFIKEKIKNKPINLILVCEDYSYNNKESENNQNIVILFNENIEKIFSEILNILHERQEFLRNTSVLMEAFFIDNGLQHLVDVGSKVIGNPFFVRDLNFNVLAHTKDVLVDDYIWNQTIKKGYQNYTDFKYLMKNGFIDRLNSYDNPIYYNIVDQKTYRQFGDEIIEKQVYPNESYYMQYKFDSDIKISRVWCKIATKKESVGNLMVLNAFRKFSDYDFILIKKLSDLIALELQKNLNENNQLDFKIDYLFLDLLEGRIKDSESLNEKLKIFKIKQENNFRVIVLNSDNMDESSMPLCYIRRIFQKILGDSHCMFFNGSLISITQFKENHHSISDLQLEQLKSFAKDIGMYCGISRLFKSLIDIPKHYRQSVQTINVGKRTNDQERLFIYDDYILQNLLQVCSENESLMNYVNSSLLDLVEYDKKNNTVYTETLHAFVNKFKNPSDLAQDLNVHRNTIYYRLDKIKEIMNVSLNAMDVLFNLYLSFKILEYLE